MLSMLEPFLSSFFASRSLRSPLSASLLLLCLTFASTALSSLRPSSMLVPSPTSPLSSSTPMLSSSAKFAPALPRSPSTLSTSPRLLLRPRFSPISSTASRTMTPLFARTRPPASGRLPSTPLSSPSSSSTPVEPLPSSTTSVRPRVMPSSPASWPSDTLLPSPRHSLSLSLFPRASCLFVRLWLPNPKITSRPPLPGRSARLDATPLTTPAPSLRATCSAIFLRAWSTKLPLTTSRQSPSAP
mmetsp:Transcript_14735/g.30310  ORF Transcript_14735/g.30310 Transcript_14735/m.30310 type:complete len:243 (+) Transcript_14735:483-1211(+)